MNNKWNFKKEITHKIFSFKWEEILDYYFKIIIITKKEIITKTWLDLPQFSLQPILLFLSF